MARPISCGLVRTAIYWTTRLQPLVWMMLRSAEFEVGRLRPDDSVGDTCRWLHRNAEFGQVDRS